MGSIELNKFFFIFLGYFFIVVQGQRCIVQFNLAGNISDSIATSYGVHNNCWEIQVPPGHFILIKFTVFSLSPSSSCQNNYMKLFISQTGEEYSLCKSDSYANPITAFSNVRVLHYLNPSGSYRETNFNLTYTIQDIQCLNNNSFKCNNHSCVPKFQVCDGVKQCKNGADELGCETGVIAVDGVKAARDKAAAWLKSKMTPSWGWREDTPRAVVALALSSSANFNGTELEEELMAKETELKTTVALSRPYLTNSQLSMFVNGLLVTCYNPRQFHGVNLIKRLKDQVVSSQNFTHPVAYLALCNANESWPLKADDDLTSVLNSDSNYLFTRDIQAMAVMAISCKTNYTNTQNNTYNTTSLNSYLEAIVRFKGYQMEDGSFGNVYATALITQALISSGQEDSRDWNLSAAVKYLMKHLNSSSVDFLSTYMTLPILHGKSLTDIAKINCSGNRRKHDLVSEINDYMGPKVQVRYSLYVGDNKDVIYTMFLRAPENYTAFEVMELAAIEDNKYRFKWEKLYNKVYVYEIAKITNDPEHGKFWLMHLGQSSRADTLKHLTDSPDQVIMEDGGHLVMWHQSAQI